MPRTHTRIIQHPFAALLQGARLDAYREEQQGERVDVVLNIQAFEKKTPEPFEREGKLLTRVDGFYVPAQLTFNTVTQLQRPDFFLQLAQYPPEDESRIIGDMLSWYQPDALDGFYLLGMRGPVDADLMFFARRVRFKKIGAGVPISFERDWSSPPPMPGRVVPRPQRLHNLFGGDPITVQIDSQSQPQRLFVGGIDIQGKARPEKIDAVLNLSESPSAWAENSGTHPDDRWDNKGEGSNGMNVEVIRAEAEWVIEHLKQNQRVLVHCVAGMNRSSTVCTAVVMLLEGLSAEDALERVRAHHPWARPDSNHWLKLMWLEKRIRL